jgi:hypothetical protein
MRMRINRRWWVSALAAATASLTAAAPAFCAPEKVAPGKGAAPGTQVAPTSQLPYPKGAEWWADAQGTPTAMPPGMQMTDVQRVQALVYRAKGDALTWEQVTGMYVEQGILPPKPAFVLQSLLNPRSLPPIAEPVVEEVQVYITQMGGAFLVLGFYRYPSSKQLLGYSVLLSGKVSAAQALVQGRAIAEELIKSAWVKRLTPPVPPGAEAAAPVQRLEGRRLRDLLQAIQRNPNVSARVKEMARVVLPQATAVTFYQWRTQAPVSDRAFFEFYIGQADRMQWGPAVSRDETQPTRPTLLFQRPNNEGVIMVRAEPTTPVLGQVNRASTTIFVLVMEGKIDISSLRSK